MAIQDDFTVDYNAKTVTHTAGTTIYSVLEFYQWLANLFAQQPQMDDDYPFVSDTPSVYRWVNGWAFGNSSNDIKFLKGGSIESSDGNELWSNLYSIGTQEVGTQLYVIQNGVEVSPWWSTGNIDILLLVKTGGIFIQSPDTSGVATDGGVWVYAREFGNKYDHNFVNLSGGGRNPVGINTSEDKDNATAEATVATWNDVTITFGTVSKDLNNGNGSKTYDVVIDGAGRTVDQVYEYLKYITRYGSAIQLNGNDGQEYRSANEATYVDTKTAPFGTMAGGTIFGAQGVWIENCATSDFSLIASDGTIQNPPNYQKVNCSHANLVGCQIFVAEIDGSGNIIKNQYTISSTTVNSITATTPIDTGKAPQSGVLRVGDTIYTYTGFTGSTFTGVTPDPSAETGSLYIPLLDVLANATIELSDNVIYNTDFDVRTTVRKYGYKVYTADTVFGVNGLSFNPILTIAPQAT